MTKRPRGRPKGTTIDDSKHLDAVADLMVRDDTLKKTPAIEKVAFKAFAEHDRPKVVRRLLRKWNETAEERLADARERLADNRHERVVKRDVPRYTGGQLAQNLASIQTAASFAQELRDTLDPPMMRSIRENLEEAEKIRNLIDPPHLRALRQMYEQANMAERALSDLGKLSL